MADSRAWAGNTHEHFVMPESKKVLEEELPKCTGASFKNLFMAFGDNLINRISNDGIK